MSVKVRGGSDDIISVEGDIDAEFNEDESCLAFSDGTVLHVEYTNAGLWRINRAIAGSASYSKWEATDSDSKEYSDVVTLGEGDATGRGTVNLEWVVCGQMVMRPK
jgi:hypothetical protein